MLPFASKSENVQGCINVSHSLRSGAWELPTKHNFKSIYSHRIRPLRYVSSNYNNLNRLRTRIIKFSLGPSWKRKTNDEQGERGVTVDCFVSKTRTTTHSVVRAKNRNHIDRRGIQDLMNQNWGFLNTLGVIFEIRGSSRIGGGL